MLDVDFVEFVKGEVRRIPIPRTPVNKGNKRGPRCGGPCTSWSILRPRLGNTTNSRRSSDRLIDLCDSTIGVIDLHDEALVTLSVQPDHDRLVCHIVAGGVGTDLRVGGPARARGKGVTSPPLS